MNRYEKIKDMSLEEMAALIEKIRADQRMRMVNRCAAPDSKKWLEEE